MVLNGVSFSREPREHTGVWACMYFQLQMNNREREVSKIFHSLRYNKCLKTGMDFRSQVWKRVWKMEYFGLKLGQDLENRAAVPYREFQVVPTPGGLVGAPLKGHGWSYIEGVHRGQEYTVILIKETFSIRFFTVNGKRQTWGCHVTTVLRSRLQFAVHVWTARRASSGKWFTARFFAFKNCTTSRLKSRNRFLYPPAMC